MRPAGGGQLDDKRSALFRITFWLPADSTGGSGRLVTRSSMERWSGRLRFGGGGGDSCRQLGFIVNHRSLTFSENNPAAQSAASHKVSTPSPQALPLLRRLAEI